MIGARETTVLPWPGDPTSEWTAVEEHAQSHHLPDRPQER